MRTRSNERRTRRSLRADQALVFQLEHVRDEAGLDALVLATEEGLPVAHSGEDELCEEIAALAPFLAGQAEPVRETRTMRVRAVTLDALKLWLVSYRRDAARVSDRFLDRASSGVARILAV